MVTGAAMMTPNVVKNLTPVVKGAGMKNVIAAIQTLTRLTAAVPANGPTRNLSECRRDRPLLRKETPTRISTSNASSIGRMTTNIMGIRSVSSRSAGLLSVAFGLAASEVHVTGGAATIRPVREHQRSPWSGQVTTPSSSEAMPVRSAPRWAS